MKTQKLVWRRMGREEQGNENKTRHAKWSRKERGSFLSFCFFFVIFIIITVPLPSYKEKEETQMMSLYLDREWTSEFLNKYVGTQFCHSLRLNKAHGFHYTVFFPLKASTRIKGYQSI